MQEHSHLLLETQSSVKTESLKLSPGLPGELQNSVTEAVPTALQGVSAGG